MPKLIIFTDNPIEYVIETDKTSIGRGNANDIILDNDTISNHHALITCEVMPDGETEIKLTDLDSTNGVYVNGNKIKDLRLKDNDQFSLGEVKCVYLNEE